MQVLSLPPSVAPIKCLLVPISNNEALKPLLREVCACRQSSKHGVLAYSHFTLAKKMRGFGISCRIDDSGASIGKRYSRNDELGTPFGVTIDFACRESCFFSCVGLPALTA